MESRSLGDYNLIKPIGQGPLGTVFLAEQRFMKRQYAIKVLPEELSSDRGFIQRFEEEVSLLSTVEHPHIVKMHNVAFSQGFYYLVTDCVVDELGETTNLGQYMLSRGKRLDEEELYRLLMQMAEAIDFAHSKKIAHRGIKLNNILVGKQEGNKIDLYLSDLGLSRIVGTGAVLSRTYKAVADALSLSMPAGGKERYPNPPWDTQKLVPLHISFLQNYAFLAPEQRRQDVVDVKADSYAFGILAYYLTVGEFPEGVFDLPSKRATEYHWNWDSLVQSCLQSNPSRRPNSLVAALKSVREETTVVQTPSSGTLRPLIRASQIDLPKHEADPGAVFQINTTVKQYVPELAMVKNIEPLLNEMVVIDGGNFLRGSTDGSRDEMPRHQIKLSSFAIDIHPVTNEQFVRFLEAMGSEKDSNHNDIIRLRDSRIKRSAGKFTIESGYAKHPVVGVTWYGSIAYARWVGKRLPMEAEWEVAAKGGFEAILYPVGDDIEKSQANFFSSDTTPVMSYAPNGIGLYDMAGNVYEWCHDWYGYNYYEISAQEPENPKGPLQGVYRVLRGGCWKSLREDLRCSRRHRNNPGTVNGTYGFRCAADVMEA